MMKRLRAAIARIITRATLDGRLRLARPWAPLAGGLGLALAVVFPARWLLYLAYAYSLVSLAGYLWMRILAPRVRLQRSLHTTWAQVGDELEERWELSNQAPLPLLGLELEDQSTLPGYSARRVIDAEAGEQIHWRTLARCGRRGRYRLGPLKARCGDPLGVFRYEWSEAHAQELVVYPPLVRLSPLAAPRGARGGLAQADLLQLFVTPNVGGLRSYTPGDPPSRVHWPYVARYGELYVKEFDQERSGALWIVLDLAADSYPRAAPEPTAVSAEQTGHYGQSSVAGDAMTTYQAADLLDLAVTLAGSLAAQALAEGRQVGLLLDDGVRCAVSPAGGGRQLWRILGELVERTAAGGRPLGELLRQSRGETSGALAVITGDLSGAWLPDLAASARGGSVGGMALLVAARATDGAPCLARLGAIGASARCFELATPLPLLNPPRRRVTARVSPLGRVIREA